MSLATGSPKVIWKLQEFALPLSIAVGPGMVAIEPSQNLHKTHPACCFVGGYRQVREACAVDRLACAQVGAGRGDCLGSYLPPATR